MAEDLVAEDLVDEDQLAAARAALERGDYGQVVRLLEPLTS